MSTARLLHQLPPDAASQTPPGAWPLSVELLAMIAEVLHALYSSFLQANGVKKHKLPKPLKVPRPRDLEPRRPARDAAEIRDVITGVWGAADG